MAKRKTSVEIPSPGAYMRDAPVDCTSPYIPIRVRELRQIALLDSWSTFFVGVAVGFAMLGFGCVWDMVVGGPLSKASKVAAIAILVAAWLLSALMGFIAHRAQLAKRSEIDEILAECPGYAAHKAAIDAAMPKSIPLFSRIGTGRLKGNASPSTPFPIHAEK